MNRAVKMWAVVSVLVLSGCARPVYPSWEPDAAVRSERFDACMKALPAGPQSTQYNDWAEVVEECGSAAYDQSLRCVENCENVPPNSRVTVTLDDNEAASD